MVELPSGTVTLLFTDIAGSTKLLHELGEQYAEALAEHRRVLREAFQRHGGVEVDTQGDAFFYAFPEAVSALAAASEAQERLAKGPVRVRMGIHTGQPIVTEEGYVGVDVHRAARVMGAGHGGQVLLSERTRLLVNGDRALTDLGLHRLKDMVEPEKLFQLGEGEFPPLKTLDATNLPVAASPLLGRERELDELLALVAEGTRMLTVTGPGGTGKTRLALQVAAELVGTYPDGVFWVPLAGVTDAELVVPTIAQTLGRDELVDHLRGKELLLLLDNLEHLLAAAPGLGELLAGAGGLRLLVTSRARLHIRGEHEYRLEPLPRSDAVTLFLERTRSAGRSLEPDKTIEAICDRLDGLPLALELAAAWTKLLDPETLLQRLEPALPLLTGGARDAPERQQTLRATIEWSYDLLDEEAKSLFGRLSVLVGSFSLEAAEEVASAGADSLRALVELGLLKPIGQSRFLMLETIREFAAERLEQSGEAEKLRRRHAKHFLELAEALGGKHIIAHRGAPERIARLAEENDNFRAVAEWSLAHGNPSLVLRLGDALWRFWSIRGYVTEGRQWLDAALAQSAQNLPERLGGLVALSELVRFEGDLARSRELKQEVLAQLPLHSEMRWIRPGILADLGDIAMMQGDYDEARRLLEESLALRSDANPDTLPGLGRTLKSLGELALSENDLQQAESWFRESRLRSAEWDPEGSQTGWSTQELAETMMRKGDHAQAGRYFVEALRIHHKLRDQDSAADCLVGLALVAAAQGHTGRAARLQEVSQGLREDAAIELDEAVDYALSSID